MGYVILCLFLSLPFIVLLSVVFWLVNFFIYRSAKRRNRKEPCSVNGNRIVRMRRRTVVSGVVAAVLAAVYTVYVVVFSYGIAHM